MPRLLRAGLAIGFGHGIEGKAHDAEAKEQDQDRVKAYVPPDIEGQAPYQKEHDP